MFRRLTVDVRTFLKSFLGTSDRIYSKKQPVQFFSCSKSKSIGLSGDIVWIYSMKVLNMSHDLTKPHDYMIKRSRNFMIGSSSWYVTTLPSLLAIHIVVVEIRFYFPRDQVRLRD